MNASAEPRHYLLVELRDTSVIPAVRRAVHQASPSCGTLVIRSDRRVDYFGFPQYAEHAQLQEIFTRLLTRAKKMAALRRDKQ